MNKNYFRLTKTGPQHETIILYVIPAEYVGQEASRSIALAHVVIFSECYRGCDDSVSMNTASWQGHGRKRGVARYRIPQYMDELTGN